MGVEALGAGVGSRGRVVGTEWWTGSRTVGGGVGEATAASGAGGDVTW